MEPYAHYSYYTGISHSDGLPWVLPSKGGELNFQKEWFPGVVQVLIEKEIASLMRLGWMWV
jgi:hypothetical protein